MAQTQPPSIDPVPTPPIQRGDRTTFSSRVDAFIMWLVNAVTQFRAVATNVYNNAVDAFQSATGAATSATNAANSATAANTSASNAANSASAAATSATNAANSATASASSAADSANSATALTATSSTNNTIGTGNKTFTVQTGKQFAVGVRVYAVNPNNAVQYMAGTVASYSGTTLTIAVDSTGGTGSVSTWNISVSGIKGDKGEKGDGAVPRMVTVVLTTGQPWTVAAVDFEVEICGGGQGGRSSRALSGGCGAYSKKLFRGATIGASANVLVGAGGAASTTETARYGGDSSFSLSGFTTVSAPGGKDTNVIASGGDINVDGLTGFSALLQYVAISNSVLALDYKAAAGRDGMLGVGAKCLGSGIGQDRNQSATPGSGYGAGGTGGSDISNPSSPGLSQENTSGAVAGRPGVCIIRYMQ